MYLTLSGTSERLFAALVGVSSVTVFHWRRGNFTPTDDSRDKIKVAVHRRNHQLLDAIKIGDKL